MLVEYMYFSGADNGWTDELAYFGFPRQDNAPELKKHGSYVCDEADFRKFFQAVAYDIKVTPFKKPRVQFIFVLRGQNMYLWRRRHFKWYIGGEIRPLSYRKTLSSGFWLKVY